MATINKHKSWTKRNIFGITALSMLTIAGLGVIFSPSVAILGMTILVAILIIRTSLK